MGLLTSKNNPEWVALTEKLVKQVEKMNSGGSNKDDDRFWKPVMDKSESWFRSDSFPARTRR